MTDTVVHETARPWVEAFAPASAVDGLSAVRARAIARFGAVGLPSRRSEAWRFTNLSRLVGGAFPPSDGTTAAPSALASASPWTGRGIEGESHRLLFVDGRLDLAGSRLGALPAGVVLGGTAGYLAERPDGFDLFDEGEIAAESAFLALNTAFFRDGPILVLPEGVALDRPIEILHVASAGAPRSLHMRGAFVLGAGARASVVETFVGEGRYFCNAFTRIALGEGARLDYAKLQDESLEAVHIAAQRARLAAGASLDSFVLTLGGDLSRHETAALVEGEGARSTLNGAYLLRGTQDATNATLVDHAAPGGSTSEVFAGVVADRAHGAFQGKLVVRREGQKTDAHQLNRNLLLGPRAVVDTKPELEIYADDVKCSHGATVGDLDAAAVFYLRSRGIPETEARAMLLEGFAGEAIDLVADAGARALLRGRVARWLEAAR